MPDNTILKKEIVAMRYVPAVIAAPVAIPIVRVEHDDDLISILAAAV